MCDDLEYQQKLSCNIIIRSVVYNKKDRASSNIREALLKQNIIADAAGYALYVTYSGHNSTVFYCTLYHNRVE
jgi:hypothetical protein